MSLSTSSPAFHHLTARSNWSPGIAGIGSGFIPENFDPDVVDEIETVTTAEAMHWARRLAREEGLLVGVSTGANVAVAHRLAERDEHAGKTIVTFACSTGERYLSTPLHQLIGMSKPTPAEDFDL